MRTDAPASALMTIGLTDDAAGATDGETKNYSLCGDEADAPSAAAGSVCAGRAKIPVDGRPDRVMS